MKKHLLLFVFLLGFGSMLFAQSLVLQNDSLENLSGIVLKPDTTDKGAFLVHVYIKNSGTKDLNVLVKKTIINAVPGTVNYFCWGNCYQPDTYVSDSYKTIAAGATNTKDFSADYIPMGFKGKSEIRYTFFDKDNPNDSASVTMIFDYLWILSGVNSPAKDNNYVSVAYPNPTTDYFTLNYRIKNFNTAYVDLFNVLGTKAKRVPINASNGSLRVNVSDLKAGVYLFSFVADGKVLKSGKILISR